MRNDNLGRVITATNSKFGAPMGRANKGNYPVTITSGNNGRICKKHQTKVYNKRVALIEGYDMGGAYWGTGSELRVEFTADLQYINFYRCQN